MAAATGEGADLAAFVMRVLTLFAMSPNDPTGEIVWRVDGPYAPITFFVDCSDTFDRGTATADRLTPANIDDMERALADIRAIDGASIYWATDLFCARQRKTRPQGASYPQDERLWPLFDACGPARELDLSNPLPPGRGR